MALLLFGGSKDSLGVLRVEQLQAAAEPLDVVFMTDQQDMLSRSQEIEVAAGAIPVPVVEQLEKLKWYQHWFAGVEHLMHLPRFVDGSTRVTNTSGVHAEPIAEQFFGMLISLGRNLHKHYAAQLESTWTRTVMDDVFELDQKSLLIVGMGAIGRRIAELGLAFGMTVTGVRRTKTDDIVPIYTLGDLPDLLPEADVIVCILPLTPETTGIFGADAFGAMKKTAIFSNFGRGGQVDQEALISSLQAGNLGGALLDVTDPEPLPSDSPLWTLPNVLITPHIGGWTSRYTERAWPILIENLRRYHGGQELMNRIDFEAGY